MRTRAGSVLNKPELSKRMSVMGDPSSDKPFPFALLPKQATVTLAKALGLVDLCRFRATAAWMRNFADEYIPVFWNERLHKAYPLLALSIEIRRRGTTKAGVVADQELDARRVYTKEVIAEFEADPESINPFDTVAVLLLYQHYRDLVNNGAYYLSVHNFGMLVALHLKIRHGIFRSDSSMSDLDSIIAARFVDKTGKLKKHLEKQWQALVIDTDKLIVSQELKLFNSHMRREYFLKLQYVMFVSSLPYFPFVVVEARQVLTGRKKTRDVLLCVSREAVLILDDKTNQIAEQFSFSRLISWAFSKELFSIRTVAERGASRKGAEEQVFITPEAQQLADAVNKFVSDIVLLESPFSTILAEYKTKLPKLLDDYLQQTLSSSKKIKAKEETPDKKLRAVNKICGDVAEAMRHRIDAHRSKKNATKIADMKRKLLAFLKSATKLDLSLRQANKGGALDVTTTVMLTSALKTFGASMDGLSDDSSNVFRGKMEELVKRVEEMN